MTDGDYRLHQNHIKTVRKIQRKTYFEVMTTLIMP